MTTLIDRYVHAVLRALPARQRADLEPDVRALVADAIEARDGDERAALAELGHPGILASRYADGPQHLLGPTVFNEWRRMLTTLLPIIVVIASSVILAVNLVGGSTVGEAITAAMGVAATAAIQTIFWMTLVFAIIERTAAPGAMQHGTAWTPDDLPEVPDDGRFSVTDLAGDLAADVILLVALLWLQFQSPIVIGGVGYSLFDPALGSFWMPWLILVVAAQIVLTVARFVRGHWTWGFAVANGVTNLAFAGPALYLLLNGMLFDPDLVAVVTAGTGDAWLRPTVAITAVVVAAIVAWDTLEGFLKARRAMGDARSLRGPAGSPR